MAGDRHQRGEGRLGLLVALAAIGFAIYVGVKLIPVRIAAYELQDFVQEECRFASVRKSDDALRRRILNKAEELDIPLDPRNLKIERRGGEIAIRANFEKPIDLKLYTYVYKFEISERAPLF